MTLGWKISIGFGLSFEDGFYLILDKNAPELLVDFDIALPLTITGTLGFLELSATDKETYAPHAGTSGAGITFKVDVANSSDANDEKIGFSEFGKLDFDAGIAADAAAELGLTLGFGGVIPDEVASGFPSLRSDFTFLWQIGSRVDTSALQPPDALTYLIIANNSTFVGLDGLATPLPTAWRSSSSPTSSWVLAPTSTRCWARSCAVSRRSPSRSSR